MPLAIMGLYLLLNSQLAVLLNYGWEKEAAVAMSKQCISLYILWKVMDFGQMPAVVPNIAPPTIACSEEMSCTNLVYANMERGCSG